MMLLCNISQLILVDVIAWVVAVVVLLTPTFLIVAFIVNDKGGATIPQSKPADTDFSEENYWRGYY
ncbi:hypothetical protein UFOVP536_52 [uncultured Caudovirales phage]|uniref:Uncharacterized protein n=1 Tax=uncultured Caudovirales phage TaxID=2100421 RepID=A0A6J5MW29_9CAUD|nr:hypothetical protein UFOVP536_52 [uncultured Caudovirales phage]